MVRIVYKWLVISLFASSVYAQTPELQNPIDYKVVQLLGVQEYQMNQKFIQRLFSNQGYFLDSKGQPDLYKISKTLKQNGLLKLTFKQPRELEVAFNIQENPTTFTSVLYNILNEMGYYYFLLKESVLEEKQFKFILSMNTEYAIDPTLLQEKLYDYGYKVQNIERSSIYQWNYTITNTSFQYPKATQLIPNQTNHKANLKGEYWYQINKGNRLEVKSSNGILWYPKLIFFDKNLNILEITSSQKTLQIIQKEIPKGAMFVKITDTFLSITTKNGLDVTLK
ncbi:hypothetical protein [uncultured Helicobacter sp.]|uniref:hypothetical protein n=1 Tax=uncultured Helicobacter sp. TaxID=175537 RepID=UPI0026209D04|nr:hypothetical protein [uncultured Helicobacter sp.]